jgi:hypothetical protein
MKKMPSNNHCDLIYRLLLIAGANPWVQDHNHHRTCLHYLAAKNHFRLIADVVESSLKVSKTAQGHSSLFQKFSRIPTTNSEADDEANASR